ncbi:MAG: hypothetical protein JW808_10240, partial [Victivallales bacterium]|nr:hypothetical protein [Victivallales bacterium]
MRSKSKTQKRCTVVIFLLALASISHMTLASDALHSPRGVSGILDDAEQVTLVKDGEIKAVIVIPDDEDLSASAIEATRKAADEFQNYIALRTGKRLQILKSANYKGGAAVFIGESKAARAAGFV